jgi:hypothetical protein
MTRLTNVRDFWSGIVLGLLGLLVTVGALQMPVGSLAQPDDGFMPLVTGSAMVALSAGLAWRSLRRPIQASQHQPFWPESQSGLRVACVIGAMLVYVVAFEWVGFVPATFALFVFLLKAIDPVPWKTTVLMSILVTVGCFLLFQVWLKVQLPAGWLSGWRIGSWIF